MWYGQISNGTGGFDSYARYFDVIAHELTHGVTETTANLVYRNISGALNESFSDIFGVIISNWYPREPNPLSSWNWEIGSGLGKGGLPLRDISNPSRTGDPDKWSKRFTGTADSGGVHTNSNIHNKAAYNVFQSKDANNNAAFTPKEVALLYYLTLTRLSRLSDFSDCRRVLTSVAMTYYSGDATAQSQKIRAIKDAYDAVGIV